MERSERSEIRRRQPETVLPEGLEAGLLGGFVVVAVFLVRDAIAGPAFYSPSVLGALALRGAEAARETGVDGAMAGAYHVAHFAIWAVAGLAGSALMTTAEERGLRWLPWGVLFVYLVGLIALDAWAQDSGLGRMHLWSGGLAGGLAMGAYLFWRHPGAISTRASG